MTIEIVKDIVIGTDISGGGVVSNDYNDLTNKPIVQTESLNTLSKNTLINGSLTVNGDITQSGSSNPIATREEIPTNNALTYWNNIDLQLKTNPDIIIDSTKNEIIASQLSNKPNTLTLSDTNIDIDLSQGSTVFVVLTATSTPHMLNAPTNIGASTELTLIIKQSSSVVSTMNFDNIFSFSEDDEPILTSNTDAVDIMQFKYIQALNRFVLINILKNIV